MTIKNVEDLTEEEAFAEIKDLLRVPRPLILGEDPARLSKICHAHGVESFLYLTAYVDAASYGLETRFTACPDVLRFAGNTIDTELISRWMMDYITDYGYASMDREDELGNSDMVLSYLDEIAAFQKQHPGVPLEIALSMTDLFSER